MITLFSSLSILSISLSSGLTLTSNQTMLTTVEKNHELTLEKNAIKISDQISKNIGLEDLKEKFDFSNVKYNNETTLEEKIQKYIKKIDVKLPISTQRFYVYEENKIQNEILDFLDNNLKNVNVNENIDNHFYNKDIDFIDKYMNLENLHQTNELQEQIADIYLKKVKTNGDEETKYLSESAWKKYLADFNNEDGANFFAQTINGWSDVHDFSVELMWGIMQLILFAVVGAIVAAAIPTGGTMGAAIPAVISTFQRIGIKLATSTAKMVTKQATKLLKNVIKKGIKAPFKQGIDYIIKEIIEKQKLNELLDKNKNFITQTYGENVWNKYSDYFNAGFDNGIAGKLNSIFGNTSVKDRAILMFDQVRNPLWDLNTVETNSIAKFREWLPWKTYTHDKHETHSIDQSKKMILFTATLATQSTWTGTYYGTVDNPLGAYYDIDYSANFLEWTQLTIAPNFTKKNIDVAKCMFISENLKNTKNVAKFYKINQKELQTDVETREKQVYLGYPTESQTKSSRFLLAQKLFN